MAGRIRSMEKFTGLIGNPTHDHLVCYIGMVADKSLAFSISLAFILVMFFRFLM
jgi:hypothetical protein